MFFGSHITDWLTQGGQPDTQGYQDLFDKVFIRSVLSVNYENPHLADAVRIYGAPNVLHIPWHDDGTPKPTEDFRSIMDWYKGLAADRKHVLVHCGMGVNRATIGSIWLLTVVDGINPYDAWSVVKNRRPIANGWNVPAYRESILRAEREILHRTSEWQYETS